MQTLGELVKKWRERSGLTHPQFARLIGQGVKYQNLQQLETGQSKHPKYIAHLAKAMGTTTDELLALRMPPPLDPVRRLTSVKGPKRLVDIPATLQAGADQVDVSEEALADAIDLLASMAAKQDTTTREAAAAMLSGLWKQPENAAQIKRVLQVMLFKERTGTAVLEPPGMKPLPTLPSHVAPEAQEEVDASVKAAEQRHAEQQKPKQRRRAARS
jgi:transcriptional regulator with XRE-family HTH domain